MTATTVLKCIVGAGLLVTWAYLVTIGKADAPALVDFIKVTLAALAAHTVFSKGDPQP